MEYPETLLVLHSEISYNSNTKELKFSSRPTVIILGYDTTLIEKSRTLSSEEEQDLKKAISLVDFLVYIVDPGCIDYFLFDYTIR
jgi:hypothetical protein